MLKSYGLAAPSNGSRTEHSRQDSWVYVGISGHLWTLGISHGLSSLMPLLWSHAGSTPITRAEGQWGGLWENNLDRLEGPSVGGPVPRIPHCSQAVLLPELDK